MQVDELLSTLTTLSPAQLEEVAARAQALRGGSSSSGKALTDESLVYDQIETVLRDMGNASVPPLRAAKGMPEWKDGVTQLTAFVDRYVQPKTRVEKVKAVRVFVRMVARYIVKVGVAPLSLKTLVQHLKKVSGIADRQFPGYRECGMLRVVVTKFSALQEH